MNLLSDFILRKDSGGNCLSTTERTNGAVAVFLPGVAERLGKLLGSGFYMVFTSIHEVMIHRDSAVEVEELIKHGYLVVINFEILVLFEGSHSMHPPDHHTFHRNDFAHLDANRLSLFCLYSCRSKSKRSFHPSLHCVILAQTDTHSSAENSK